MWRLSKPLNIFSTKTWGLHTNARQTSIRSVFLCFFLQVKANVSLS